MKLWDVQTQDCLHSFFDHDGSVGQARFHPDGTCVAACSADGTIKVCGVVRGFFVYVCFGVEDGVVRLGRVLECFYLRVGVARASSVFAGQRSDAIDQLTDEETRSRIKRQKTSSNAFWTVNGVPRPGVLERLCTWRFSG